MFPVVLQEQAEQGAQRPAAAGRTLLAGLYGPQGICAPRECVRGRSGVTFVCSAAVIVSFSERVSE